MEFLGETPITHPNTFRKANKHEGHEGRKDRPAGEGHEENFGSFVVCFSAVYLDILRRAGQMTPDVVRTPPRWAERLLGWSLAPDERAAVLGDVQEEFGALADQNPARAARWYWRQTLASVIPNIARQIRNQWAEAREVVNDDERRARRRRLVGGLSWTLLMGFIFGLLVALNRSNADDLSILGLMLASPGILLVISSGYRASNYSLTNSVRGGLMFAAWTLWSALGVAHRAPDLMWSLEAFWSLLWMWPRAMWPFRRALPVRGFSVRSPVLTSLSSHASFSTVIVPPEPWAMSPAIVGRAEPPVLAAGSLREDAVPLLPTPTRTFAPDESIRLFVVVNANPEGLRGTLEIRSDSYWVPAPVAADVTAATPKLPYRPQYGVDPDSELPRLPVAPMAELNSVVSLSGMGPGPYTLRLTVTNGEMSAHQDTAITIFSRLRRW